MRLLRFDRESRRVEIRGKTPGNRGKNHDVLKNFEGGLEKHLYVKSNQ